jgi:hypothetical protein
MTPLLDGVSSGCGCVIGVVLAVVGMLLLMAILAASV